MLCPSARHIYLYCLVLVQPRKMSRHDRKIVDWDVKTQPKRTNKPLHLYELRHEKSCIFTSHLWRSVVSLSKTLYLHCLGQSFFIFRFTDSPDPIFWKLKKKKRDFFQFYFLFSSDSCSPVMFFRFVFSIAARLIKVPPVTALGEILPF